MSQGNFSNARSDFSAIRSLIALLQRSIRINKHSQLLWKEYFRFELGYVNLIEERRRVLGLSVGLSSLFWLQSLRERLLGDEKDKTLEELMEKELSESESSEAEAESSESESDSSSQKSQDGNENGNENENDEDVNDLELLEDNEESCESEFSF